MKRIHLRYCRTVWSKGSLLVLALMSWTGLMAQEAEHLRLALIARESAALQTQPVRAGAAAAAEEIGARLGYQVELLDWTPAAASAAEQAEALRRAYVDNVDGVLLNCQDAVALSPVIDFLAEKGIPVVTFEHDAPQSRRVASSVTDEIALGRLLATELLQSFGRRSGGVAILAGDMSKPANLQRLQGVMEVLDEYKLPVVGVHPAKETAVARETLRAVEQVDRNRAISGWIFLGGWPLEAGTPLPWPTGSFTVVAADELPVFLPYIVRNEVYSLVATNYFDFGYEGVRLLLDAIRGEAAPGSSVIAEVMVIDPSNLLQRQQQWIEWLR